MSLGWVMSFCEVMSVFVRGDEWGDVCEVMSVFVRGDEFVCEYICLLGV